MKNSGWNIAAIAAFAGLAGAVGLGFAGWAQTGGGLPYTDVQAVARGAEIYAENCASCHGVDLAGEANWRQRKPDGRLPAPPHDASGHTWHHPDEVLIAITTHGSEAIVGGGYESDMPGFASSLGDAQIREVLAFIKSTWPAEVIEMHNDMNDG